MPGKFPPHSAWSCKLRSSILDYHYFLIRKQQYRDRVKEKRKMSTDNLEQSGEKEVDDKRFTKPKGLSSQGEIQP